MPPALQAKPVPPQPATGSNPAEATLKQLTAALKKGEVAVTPEIQGILDTMAATDSKAEIKTLKEAADRLGSARKTLQQTRAARLQMQDRWRKFVAQGVSRWQGFTEACKKQEAELDQQIALAMEELRGARKHLEASRSKATDKAEVMDGGEISEEDFMATEPQTLGASMEGFVQNLVALQRQAEDSYEQEYKRQRKLQERQVKLDNAEAPSAGLSALGSGGPSAPTASMVPFGTPGQ